MSRRGGLSRRQFLVQSASLAGASIGGRVVGLPATRGEASHEPVRVGIIGLGDRGRNLLGAALANDGVAVTALCDAHPDRLARSLEATRRQSSRRGDGDAAVRGYQDPRALLRSGEIDAVVIATPVDLHRDQTLAALDARLHVYCEKPMALDASQCRELLAACRSAEADGLIYQSGFQRRYNSRYRASLAFLGSGECGPVRFLRTQWHAVSAAPKDKPWLHRRERSGDVVVEQGCHQFDICNWVFGEPPLSVQAHGGAGIIDGPPGRDVLDQYTAIIEFSGQRSVQMSYLGYAIPERRFSGIYELAFCETSGVDLANALAWDGAGKTRELSHERGNETRAAFDAFIDGLFRGTRPLADAEVAYFATLAALTCRRAVETNEKVKFADVLST